MPPSGHARLVAVSFVVALVACTCCQGQSNNSVNHVDGSIVWGQLAPDSPYQTVDYRAEDGGLDPYYALAVSLIDSSLPEVLPVDTVKDVLDGKASIGDSWQDLAKQFVGYALCVVIGFLFIFIFPIVACCFCCCRCCGNCGGKRIQHRGPNDRCKRVGFAISLSILSLFVLTGAACVFVTSDQVHKNLGGLKDSFSQAVGDFNTFADNVDKQFRSLGDTNFQFLTSVLKDYVNNASPKVSSDLITAINKAVNLDTPLNQISALSRDAVLNVQQLKADVAKLSTERDTAKQELALINPTCSNCLNSHIAYLNGLDSVFTTMDNYLTTFENQVKRDVFAEMKNDLNTAIKTEVEKQTTNINVTSKLDTIYDDNIKGMLDKVSTFKTELNTTASDYQKFVGDMVDFIKPYETYRWYAGVGLASLLGMLAVMLLVGVVLGVCCSSVHDKPTQRGSAANCGGICLMAAVGLVFLFGALLMLLCTLMYMTGSPTERYVCQTADHLDRLEKYSRTFDMGMDLSNYSIQVNGETVYLSINGFMMACKEGKTLYTAIGLEGVVDSALKKIEEYKKEMNKIKNINASKAATDTTSKVDVADAVNDLKATVTSVGNLKQSVTTLKTNLQNQKTSAAATPKPIAASKYDPMLATLTSMEASCDTLKATAVAIKDAATQLESTELPQALNKLNDQTFMASLITNVTNDFFNKIIGFVDSYTNDIKAKLRTDVAKCSPFYSIYNAILGEAVCHGFVDPLNGFWLALGWCLFFFMPSIILAVKLAKHYRTMLYEDSYDSTTGYSPPPPYVTEASAPPKTTLFPPVTGPNNKVAPF